MLLWIAVTCWVCRYDCSHWIFKGQEQLILPFLFHFILLPSPLQVGFCWKQWLRYGWSSVRASDLPGSSQPQCNGVSHPLSCLEACCDFLVLKEFCPIPPVGWPGLEDFPLVQWLSDPVRYWPVRDGTARQDLGHIEFRVSSCPSCLLSGVCSYSFFAFLKHRIGSETLSNKIQRIDKI